MPNLKYLDVEQCLLYLSRLPNNNDNDVDVFFFQSSKPETGLKTPAKQNGMKHEG